MEQNELETIQNQTGILFDKFSQLNDSQAKMSESFVRMGTFVKENFNKIQSQLDANMKPERTYVVHPTKSPEIGELSKAMAIAKSEIGSISKGGMAARGKFASLDDMFEVCDPVLAKFELSTTFGLNTNEYGDFVLTMVLSHSSGQWIENRALLKEGELDSRTPYHQRVAGAEKSLRRYMYRAMLNLAENSD